MPFSPLDDLDDHDVVEVLPRHLAGPGIHELSDVWPFPFDQDWTLAHSEDGPTIAISPGMRLLAGHIPSEAHPRGGEWLVAAHKDPFRPAIWTATLDASTPVELVRDLYAEVLALCEADRRGERDLLRPDDVRPQDVYLPLLTSGWQHTVKTDGVQYFRSPDGYGVLQHAYVHKNLGAPVWSAWGGPPDYPLWKATFSSAVPASLVAGFASSLASPVPLARAVWNIPADTRLHLTLPAAPADAAAHQGAPVQRRASMPSSPTLSSAHSSVAGVPGTAPAPSAPPAPPLGRRR
ncbi:hypothetical protein QFZ66_001861 [Streptomyces sp. B4I13]|uniref:DUF317 domain-containing protein n=1 Tax=Streptomyces sp. B4I13 TaxID=3042271 RepID=UPI00277E165A|nr:DUF317 domain-containing protein [Streptomyces sp. B4I13]MDQ0957983.1 hypothetical protein [Streptomyces sp. B4I13]